MATFDYAPLIATTLRLITKYGAAVQIIREGSAGIWTRKYDVEASRTYWEDTSNNIVFTIPTASKSTFDGFAVLTSWDLDLIETGVVESSDTKVTISISVEIHNGDLLVLASGREYQIVEPIKRIAPDEESVIVQVVNARG